MGFNARFNMSHHGPPHPFRDAWVVANSLTGIHSAMVKWPFVHNRSCIHKDIQVSPHVKYPEESNLAGVEAMQWDLLYLPVGHGRHH
jgi:hypothetical protein